MIGGWNWGEMYIPKNGVDIVWSPAGYTGVHHVSPPLCVGGHSASHCVNWYLSYPWPSSLPVTLTVNATAAPPRVALTVAPHHRSQMEIVAA
jgi:hypothetical protein